MPARTSKNKNVHKAASARRTTNGSAMQSPLTSRAETPQRELSMARATEGASAPMPKVHCTLAPMQSEYLLLPTNVIAEVVEYLEPKPVTAAPQWFLGQIEWENRQIPVFSYAALISGSQPQAITGKAHIMIVKSLSDSARMPYLGILISDIPKLVSVQLDQLAHTSDERKSLGVFCHVTVNEQPAIIPDLERLTHLVTHAAYGILPITQAT